MTVGRTAEVPFSGAAPGSRREEVRGVGGGGAGRRLRPRLVRDRQEPARSAGLQARRAARRRRRRQGWSPAPRVQPPGVCARRAQRRASAPPRAHAAARGPGGGRGRARPGEGKGPVLPAQAAAAAAQEAEAEAAAAAEQHRARRSQPGRVGPAPARAGAPSPLSAVSTSRGAHPGAPAGLRRASPGPG
ncbi:skin secretory protein xP2-like [Lynx rufus]|uniref:skin secretory protein xP2-like n=1 Tax=Lynx rufus TaxID=61384 RepID=UPI001F12606B|nr:skin secretory protein xP2-like [Lynx rufus]